MYSDNIRTEGILTIMKPAFPLSNGLYYVFAWPIPIFKAMARFELEYFHPHLRKYHDWAYREW